MHIYIEYNFVLDIESHLWNELNKNTEELIRIRGAFDGIYSFCDFPAPFSLSVFSSEKFHDKIKFALYLL